MGEPVPCAASAVSWLEQLVRSLATHVPKKALKATRARLRPWLG